MMIFQQWLVDDGHIHNGKGLLGVHDALLSGWVVH